MKKCIMTESAVKTIHEESMQAFKHDKETGGILMGPKLTDRVAFITAATGPGFDSRRATYASWETDPEYLNGELRRLRGENPGINLRGFWHRHPGQMSHPSSQDLYEARNILADKRRYKLDGKLLMPIVTAAEDGVTIHCHYIDDDDQRFMEIPIEVVSDNCEVVMSAVSDGETTEIEEETGFSFWQDEGWQFYKILLGARRLETEMNGLREMGYGVSAKLLDSGECCVELREGEMKRVIVLLLPREYPLNPPRVFIDDSEDMRELTLGNASPLCRWSSGFQLVELASFIRTRVLNYKREGNKGVLMAMREDFRHGNCNISIWLRHLAGLLRLRGIVS